jgi:NADP-dependent 3-hydroxy acid dehydrogenase YdfG
MDKKIVLVTGASSGIGEAVAFKVAGRHHTVILSGRNRKKLEAMERAMASEGQRVVAIPGDLREEEQVRFVVAESLKTFGAIHAVVHCAGVFRMNKADDTPMELWREVLETNLTSTFLLAKYILPHFYRQGFGHFVGISSIAGRQGFPGETAYCASKWGLMGFLASLRMEARERGVRVTAVLPGATLTPAWNAYEGKLPSERMMAAACVADAVAFALDQPVEANVDEMLLMPSRDPFESAGKAT